MAQRNKAMSLQYSLWTVPRSQVQSTPFRDHGKDTWWRPSEGVVLLQPGPVPPLPNPCLKCPIMPVLSSVCSMNSCPGFPSAPPPADFSVGGVKMLRLLELKENVRLG